jgi:hypothetical protein
MRALYLLLALLLSAVLICTSCNDSQPAANSAAIAAAPPATAQEAASDSVFTLPADKPVDVKLEFAKASHAGAPGKLSDLQFNVSAACEERALKSDSITLNAEHPQEMSRLDLEEYKVEVRPIVDGLVNLDKGSYGAYGGYRISVRNSAGESMCCLEVNKKGELSLLGTDCKKYSPYQSLAVPSESKWRYTIYPKDDSAKHAPLLAVEYTGGGFANQDINDKAGNSYAYRFPNATLKIYNSKLAQELKDEVASEASAYMGGGGAAACGAGG